MAKKKVDQGTVPRSVRIVAKIEELFGILDGIKEALEA